MKIELFGSKKNTESLKKASGEYLSWKLSDRQLCDLELLLNGGFSPLGGFMNKIDYQSVLKNMRLKNGKLFPIPITLDVSDNFSKKIKSKDKITLRDEEGFPLAVMVIKDIWKPDLQEEAELVYGTKNENHPAVNYLLNISNQVYIGGKIKGISLPKHYDYQKYRHTPQSMKSQFRKRGWKKIIAFQTRNPLHRAHVEMTMKSIKDLNANLLLHPVVGITKPGDVDHYTRVRCYKHVMTEYNSNSAMLSLLPLAMRMGGPKEALLHALIRKNYGCTHLIVGRDHAGPGADEKGKNYYGPYDAQKLLLKYQNEIGIKMVPFKFMVYLPDKDKYAALDKIKKSEKFETISGTELRRMLDKGKPIPSWFTYPKVSKELYLSIPPLDKRGFTIFFTGLSGSGKSTLANGLMVRLLEDDYRNVTLLDGDIIRTHLSSELGFSKAHRSLNVQRIGYVASEITKNGGVAICAPIAPYNQDRRFNRELISKFGGYIEIFVSTSLEKCEERDVKGLYALARKGIIKEFTGISDPYETPKSPDIIINSSGEKPEKLVDVIIDKIKGLGYIK